MPILLDDAERFEALRTEARRVLARNLPAATPRDLGRFSFLFAYAAIETGLTVGNATAALSWYVEALRLNGAGSAVTAQALAVYARAACNVTREGFNAGAKIGMPHG